MLVSANTRIAALAVAFSMFAPALATASSWSDFRDDRFGVSILYPAGVFDQTESKNAAVNSFASADGKAKFVIGAWTNDKRDSPSAFRRSLLEDTDRYGDVTYHPAGGNWFVLSGYRGEDIYYEKVEFSCGGEIVNVFAIAYPSAERGRYDGIVERMEDSFHAGRSCSEARLDAPRG